MQDYFAQILTSKRTLIMKNCLPRLSASPVKNIVLLAIVAAFCVAPALAEDATDVTSVVAAAVKGNKLSISASNGTFGDTAPGIPKKLHVEYRAGEEKLQRDVNEGEKLEIAAPVGKKLVITKAVYGPADGSRPVSVENASEVLDAFPASKSNIF